MIVCFTATDLPQDIWNYSLCDVQNVSTWTKVGTILNQLCLATVSLHIVLIRWNSALYPVYLLLKSHQFVFQHHLDRAICGRNVWHNNSIFSPQFHSLQMERLKIAPMRFAFHANLSTSAIHRRCAGDRLEQITERWHWQPVTTSQLVDGTWEPGFRQTIQDTT